MMPVMAYGDGTEFTRRAGPRKGEFVKRYRGTDGRWHSTSWKKKPSRSAITDRIERLSRPLPDPEAAESVGAFLARWLRDGTAHVRARTLHGYRVRASGISKALGDVPLLSLSTPIIQRWIGKGGTHHELAVLRAALSEAVRWGDLSSNPARGVRVPPQKRKAAPAILSPAQVDILLAQVKGDPLEALYVLSIFTGLRQGEALGLRWEDITGDTLTVSTSLWWRPGPKGRDPVLTVPKTERSRRAIRLHPLVVEKLAEHRKAQLAGKPNKDNLVFTRPTGEAIEPSTVYRALQRHLKAAGLPIVRWHDLRHSTASMLLASGMEVGAVSELLGHSTSYTTLTIYSHTLEERRNAVADRMGTLLTTSVHQSVSDEAESAG